MQDRITSQPETSLDLPRSTLGGSETKAMPRLRSKHRGIEYRTALRIACAEGDGSTIWIPKMSQTDQAEHLRQPDQLFDDPTPIIQETMHEPRPKAQHPWNRKVGAGKQADVTNIVPAERTVPALMPESTREPPMPHNLMPENTQEPPMRAKVTLPQGQGRQRFGPCPPHQNEAQDGGGWLTEVGYRRT